jgi:DNA repair photolyase
VAELDPKATLLHLFAPLSLGDEVARGARLMSVSTELGMRLGLLVDGVRASVNVAPRELTPRHAATSKHFAFSYRSDELEDARGLEVCEALAERAVANEASVLGALSGSVAGTVDAPRIRRVDVTTLLEPAGTSEERYYTLSPYVGCLIGCRFCYAQSHLAAWRALVGLPDAPWGSYVEVRQNAPEVLREELRDVERLPIKFCPIVSDPYHAVEKREGLTRRCLEALMDAEPRDVLVLTRASLVRRDLDLLGALKAYLGVSLPTVDDRVRAHFEPRGATVEQRLAVLSDARASGARTFAIVQPLLPGSIDALADALASTVSSARVDVLHGVEGASAEFAHPDFAEARGDAWQEERAGALVEALRARGVAVWSSELPPAD